MIKFVKKELRHDGIRIIGHFNQRNIRTARYLLIFIFKYLSRNSNITRISINIRHLAYHTVDFFTHINGIATRIFFKLLTLIRRKLFLFGVLTVTLIVVLARIFVLILATTAAETTVARSAFHISGSNANISYDCFEDGEYKYNYANDKFKCEYDPSIMIINDYYDEMGMVMLAPERRYNAGNYLVSVGLSAQTGQADTDLEADMDTIVEEMGAYGTVSNVVSKLEEKDGVRAVVMEMDVSMQGVTNHIVTRKLVKGDVALFVQMTTDANTNAEELAAMTTTLYSADFVA